MPSLDLPAEVASVSRARAFVTENAAGIVPDVDAVLLMTSELATNLVLHLSSEFTVTVDPGPPLRVEIHDGSAATAAFRELIRTRPAMASTASIAGRGIGIVHPLATKIGLDDTDRGKAVWFEVDGSSGGD